MELTLKQCVIRDWDAADADAVARYANNRAIWKNLRDMFPHPYTREHAVTFVRSAASDQPQTAFAIAMGNEAIGAIGLRLEHDVHRFTGELGFWLAQPFWGRGLMTEAVRGFVPFAFETFGLVRLQSLVFEPNRASARVLEKAGFTCDGRLRASVFKDGTLLDSLLYSRIKDQVAAETPD